MFPCWAIYAHKLNVYKNNTYDIVGRSFFGVNVLSKSDAVALSGLIFVQSLALGPESHDFLYPHCHPILVIGLKLVLYSVFKTVATIFVICYVNLLCHIFPTSAHPKKTMHKHLLPLFPCTGQAQPFLFIEFLF